MKKICFVPIFIFNFCVAYTQNVGIGTLTPNASAQVDITSTARGLLIPRMSTSSVTSISNPARGLLVYDSAKNQLMVNMGTATAPDWQTVVANSGWGLNGNTGTSPSAQFLGTTDSIALVIKTNNKRSGYIDVSPNANTGFGYKSLLSNTTGFYNTALGSNVLVNNTTGERNTSVGSYSMSANTTGSFNTAAGLYALQANVSGSYNTAAGVNALVYNSSGSYNTAAGVNALYGNTEGFFNTGIGMDALHFNNTGSENTANGYTALYSNTTGIENTANGSKTLYYNTSGEGNTASGVNALYSNSTGSGNVAAGGQALYSNTAGIGNVADGYNALRFNTTGNDNTGIGTTALYNNTSGAFNAAAGGSALGKNTSGNGNTAIGDNALFFNTTGSFNVAIGKDAGHNPSYNSGDDIFYNNNNCIFLGYLSHPFDPAVGSLSGYENAIAIGYDAQVEGSNRIRLGNSSITSIGGFTGWSNISDGRFKKNIQQNVKGLDFIMKLQPVTYNLDLVKLNSYYRKNSGANATANQEQEKHIAQKEAIIQSGFIAQDVKKAAVDCGYDFSGIDLPESSTGTYGLRYAEFVVPLVKGMQEQQEIIKNLQKQVNELKALIKKQ